MHVSEVILLPWRPASAIISRLSASETCAMWMGAPSVGAGYLHELSNRILRREGEKRVSSKPMNEKQPPGGVYQSLLQVTSTKCRRDFRLILRPSQRVM